MKWISHALPRSALAFHDTVGADLLDTRALPMPIPGLTTQPPHARRVAHLLHESGERLAWKEPETNPEFAHEQQ